MIIAVLLFLLTLGADRLTKLWALDRLVDAPIALFPGCNFILAWNKGVSWSMFADSGPQQYVVLLGFIVLVVAWFTGYTVWRAYHGHRVWLEALILGGAVSNLVDRFVYGAVIDFIQLYVPVYSFPVFNIADACIVLGVFGLFFMTICSTDKH